MILKLNISPSPSGGVLLERVLLNEDSHGPSVSNHREPPSSVCDVIGHGPLHNMSPSPVFVLEFCLPGECVPVETIGVHLRPTLCSQFISC